MVAVFRCGLAAFVADFADFADVADFADFADFARLAVFDNDAAALFPVDPPVAPSGGVHEVDWPTTSS